MAEEYVHQSESAADDIVDTEEEDIESPDAPPAAEIRRSNAISSTPHRAEVPANDENVDTFVDHRSSGKKTPKTYSNSKPRSSHRFNDHPMKSSPSLRTNLEEGGTSGENTVQSSSRSGTDEDAEEPASVDSEKTAGTLVSQLSAVTSGQDTMPAERSSKSVEASSVLAVDTVVNTNFDIAGMPADDVQHDQGAFHEGQPDLHAHPNEENPDLQISPSVPGEVENDDDDASTVVSESENIEQNRKLARAKSMAHKSGRGGKRSSSSREDTADVLKSEAEDDEEPPTKKYRTSGASTSQDVDTNDEEGLPAVESQDDGVSQIPARLPTQQTSRPKKNDDAHVKADSHQGDESDSELDLNLPTLPLKKAGANTASSSSKKTAPTKTASTGGDEDEDEEELMTTTRSTDKSSNSKASSSSNKTPSRDGITKTPATSTTKSSAKATSVQESASASSTPASSARPPNKLLFSGSALSTANKTWLKRQINVVDEIPGKRTNYAVIVRGQNIPTTVKVLRALIAGKRVVTDQWVVDSKKEGVLLDFEDYAHPDLDEDVATDARRTLFTRKTLFFTRLAVTTYGDGWKDVKTTAMEAGALIVETGAAFKGAEEQFDKDNVIFFGVENDTDADDLKEKPYKRTVYDKKMFAQAIIRGKLELDDDEFVLE